MCVEFLTLNTGDPNEYFTRFPLTLGNLMKIQDSQGEPGFLTLNTGDPNEYFTRFSLTLGNLMKIQDPQGEPGFDPVFGSKP